MLTVLAGHSVVQRWALPLSFAGILLATVLSRQFGTSFVHEYASANQPSAVVNSDVFGQITTRLTWIWVAVFGAMTVSSAIPAFTAADASILDTHAPAAYVGYWVAPFTLLGLGALATRIVPDWMTAAAGDIVRKTTFVAYHEATIDELYYLATEHANREVGAGEEAYAVKVGSKGTALVGDDSRNILAVDVPGASVAALTGEVRRRSGRDCGGERADPERQENVVSIHRWHKRRTNAVQRALRRDSRSHGFGAFLATWRRAQMMTHRSPQPGTFDGPAESDDDHSLLRTRLDPCLIGVLAAVISLAGAGRPSFWYDEAATVSASYSRSLPQLWQMLGNVDAVEGAYYLLMHGWFNVFPPTEFWSRVPSGLAVGGTAAGVVVLSKLFVSRSAAIASGVVCAILPRTTWAGIEARPYALSMMAAVWLTVLLVHAARRENAWAWVCYGTVLALSALLDVYVLLLVLPYALFICALERRRTVLAGFAVTSGLAGCAVTPFLAAAVGQAHQIGWMAGWLPDGRRRDRPTVFRKKPAFCTVVGSRRGDGRCTGGSWHPCM